MTASRPAALAGPPLVGDRAAEHVQQAAHAHDAVACVDAATAADALRIGDHLHLQRTKTFFKNRDSPSLTLLLVQLHLADGGGHSLEWQLASRKRFNPCKHPQDSWSHP